MAASSQFLLVSAVGFVLQISAIVAALVIITRSSRRAQVDASKAQEDAAKAQRQAADAARLLIESTKVSEIRLGHISATGDATHRIVNNQRTVMLRMVAALAKRVADENPTDEDAQKSAKQAAADALTADSTNDASAEIGREAQMRDDPQSTAS